MKLRAGTSKKCDALALVGTLSVSGVTSGHAVELVLELMIGRTRCILTARYTQAICWLSR